MIRISFILKRFELWANALPKDNRGPLTHKPVVLFAYRSLYEKIPQVHYTAYVIVS